MSRRLAGVALVALVGGYSTPTAALAAPPPPTPAPEEPFVPNEPFVLHEPGSVVDVLDAADGRDPFDIEISLGFAFIARWAKIVRTDTSGDVVEESDFRESTSLLVPHVEVGLYKDLAFVADLPIALSRAHSITRTAEVQTETYFPADFEGPSRSGPLYLGLGLQGDVLNQTRRPAFPTWLVGAFVRVPLVETAHACTEKPLLGQVKCADPADANRNGVSDGDEPRGIGTLSEGMGRGEVGLDVRTVVSRRVGYLEPYGGVTGSIHVPVGSSDLARAVDSGAAFPPVVIQASVGTLIIPWEDRERFGRLTFDVRASVDAHTEGSDASALFDALGSSPATSLRATPSGVLPFSGITRVEAYPTGRLFTEAIWQTSQYVRLSFATALAYDGNHRLTLEDPSLATSRPSIANGASGYSARDALTLSITARGAVTF